MLPYGVSNALRRIACYLALGIGWLLLVVSLAGLFTRAVDHRLQDVAAGRFGILALGVVLVAIGRWVGSNTLPLWTPRGSGPAEPDDDAGPSRVNRWYVALVSLGCMGAIVLLAALTGRESAYAEKIVSRANAEARAGARFVEAMQQSRGEDSEAVRAALRDYREELRDLVQWMTEARVPDRFRDAHREFLGVMRRRLELSARLQTSMLDGDAAGLDAACRAWDVSAIEGRKAAERLLQSASGR